MDEATDIEATDESAHTNSRTSARSARVEIITGGERRRRWTPEQKREIVADSYGGKLTPTEVTRKHGISSGQLYTRRREMPGIRSAVVTRATPRFAEVETAGSTLPAGTLDTEPANRSPRDPSTRAATAILGHCEIVFGQGLSANQHSPFNSGHRTYKYRHQHDFPLHTRSEPGYDMKVRVLPTSLRKKSQGDRI